MTQVNFDAFVSYDELTGDKYAEKIREALARRNVSAFVAHLERDKHSEKFEEYIDSVISNCKHFILVLTLDTLKRPQVIREVKQVLQVRKIENHNFWVFREDLDTVPRSNEDFEQQTKAGISGRNQQDFRNESHLATRVLVRCDKAIEIQNISIKTDKTEVILNETYDLFTSYASRIVYDYEHYEEIRSGRTKPIIDLMSRSDLFKFFVPQTVTFETREKNPKTKKFIYVTKEKAIDHFFLEWLNGSSKFCILLGDYGSGKSSFALNLAYTLAKSYSLDEKARVPIFVSLRNYASDLDIHKFLSNLLIKQYGVKVDAEAFVKLLEEGQFLLILDGFDEMATKTDKKTTISNFKELTRLISGRSKLILTSRTHYFRSESEMQSLIQLAVKEPEVLKDIDVVEIKPFSPDQIVTFLRKRTTDWQKQITAINSIYNLADLAERPLLLDMISQTLGHLLTTEQEIDASLLYRTYTGLWIDHDDWRSVMKPIGKRAFMEELAMKMFLTNRLSQHYRKLSKPIAEHFKSKTNFEEQKDYFYYDATTCSFLHRDKSGYYSFIHKSFMEYFVAEKLASDIINRIGYDFGGRLITKEILEFLVAILRRKVKESQAYGNELNEAVLFDTLYQFIRRTRDDYASEYIGSNAITLIIRMSLDFRQKDFKGCKMPAADLANAKLTGLIFDDAVMKAAKMSNCELIECRFNDTNLSQSDLYGTKLRKVKMIGANMRGARLVGIQGQEVSLADADLSRASLSGSTFQKVTFAGAVLKDTDFVGSHLEGAIFKDIKSEKANFEGCKLMGSNFRDAKLYDAILVASNIVAADFSSADLTGIVADNITVNAFTTAVNAQIDSEAYQRLPNDFRKIIDRDSRV